MSILLQEHLLMLGTAVDLLSENVGNENHIHHALNNAHELLLLFVMRLFIYLGTLHYLNILKPCKIRIEFWFNHVKLF